MMEAVTASPKHAVTIKPVTHYITLGALLISNLSVLMLGVVFSNMMGYSMGSIAEQGYQSRSAQAAARMYDDGTGGSSGGIGGGGGNSKQPQLMVTVMQDPKSALVQRGANLPVASFDLRAVNDDIRIDGFSFTDVAPTSGIIGDKDLIYNLILFEQTSFGPVQIAMGSFPADSHYITLVPTTTVTILKNYETRYTLQARFSDPGAGNRWYQKSGAGLAMQLYAVQARPVYQSSKGVVVNGTGMPGSSFWSFKSIPTVVTALSDFTKTVPTTSMETIAKVSITSKATGPVGIAELAFTTNNPAMLFSPNELYLYASDASATLGELIAGSQDITLTGNVIRARFDVNNDDWSPHNRPGMTDHFIIPLGTTKFFTLRAFTASTTGTLTTRLLPDAQPAGTWPMHVMDIESYAPSSNFIWSDLNFNLFSSSTATATQGWFNGFLVPGL